MNNIKAYPDQRNQLTKSYNVLILRLEIYNTASNQVLQRFSALKKDLTYSRLYYILNK